jgi:hypothetical protein
MRLIKLIYLVIILLTLSCTDEPTLNNYSVSIKNNSSQAINIFTYSNNDLISNIRLDTSESGLNCTYTDEFFQGYKYTVCQIDSIVFRFDNQKGYISDINSPSSFDFPNSENPFGSSSKFVETNDTYEFIISQEDYDNALELPE